MKKLLIPFALFLFPNPGLAQDTIFLTDGTYFTGKIYDINAKYVKLIERTYLHQRVAHEEVSSISYTRPGCAFDEKGELYVERRDSSTLSQNDLYNEARLWFARTFASDEDIIRIDDKEAGLISGRIGIETITPGISRIDVQLGYTITVQFKEYKYRILVENLTIRGREPDELHYSAASDLGWSMKEDYYTETGTVEQWGKFLERQMQNLHLLIDDLEGVLKQGRRNDW